MAISDRLKSIGSRLKREEEADRQRASITERARAVLQTSKNPRARQRAREILARADPGTGAGSVDEREKSRTQKMFERAERSATAAAPIEASLDPTPDPYAMWAFAMATPQESGPSNGEKGASTPGVSAELPMGRMGEMAMVDASGLLGNGEPDWHDNPDHLDTPDEVRDDLRESGLDPMNVGTEEEATFGHFLIHGFEDDEGLGGRTADQLEAEHDMTVEAMADFGVGHESPMDAPGGAFDFDDEWGLGWGDD